MMMGKLCLAGTRIPVYLVLEKLAAGESAQQILAAYPQLKPEHIQASLKHAARLAAGTVHSLVCNQPGDVVEVTALDGFRLQVRFNDGVEGHVEMGALIHSSHAGVFAALADPARFAEAYVQYGAVTWPGELDLAPDVMYEEIKKNGKWVLT